MVCIVLQVFKTAILARLIAKEDFGLFATAAVVLGFAEFFVEAGLGSAVIHKQDATRDDLAVAYTINIVLGWLVFVGIYFLSIPIADFYSDDRLAPILRLVSLIFLFQPLGRQFEALFRRDLKFSILAKIDILAAVVGFAVSLVLAWKGMGVKALVWSQISLTFFRMVFLLWLGTRQFGFKIGFSFERAKFFLRFGMFQICENSVNYFNTQLDTILIGKLLGQETLGVFFMAKQLAFRPIQIFNPVINTISMPVFARIQNEEERLKSGYLRIVHTLAIIHFALFTILAGFADEVIAVFLGNQWISASPLLKILVFYTMLRAIGNPVGSLLVAKGKVDLGFYWNLSMLFVTPVITIFASKFGAAGIAWGLFFSMLGAMVPCWYFLIQPLCGASFKEYFGNIFKTALIVAVCFGNLLFISEFWHKIVVCLFSLGCYILYNWSKLKFICKQ